MMKCENHDELPKFSKILDENGKRFVLTNSGNLFWGKIIQGCGLVHIEARHGNQIRNATVKIEEKCIIAILRLNSLPKLLKHRRTLNKAVHRVLQHECFYNFWERR